jgi:hypothetical protein
MMKNRRRKVTKAERKAAQEREMQQFLKRMGYSGSGPKESMNEIPRYVHDSRHKTSDRIPSNGSKIKQNAYTGDELLGLSTLHKSNTVPIRKDNKQAAVETAQMRRN